MVLPVLNGGALVVPLRVGAHVDHVVDAGVRADPDDHAMVPQAGVQVDLGGRVLVGPHAGVCAVVAFLLGLDGHEVKAPHPAHLEGHDDLGPRGGVHAGCVASAMGPHHAGCVAAAVGPLVKGLVDRSGRVVSPVGSEVDPQVKGLGDRNGHVELPADPYGSEVGPQVGG